MIYGYIFSKCYIIDPAGLWEIGPFYDEEASNTFGILRTSKQTYSEVAERLSKQSVFKNYKFQRSSWSLDPIQEIRHRPTNSHNWIMNVECLVDMDWRSTISVRDRRNTKDMEPHDFKSSHPSPQEIC